MDPLTCTVKTDLCQKYNYATGLCASCNIAGQVLNPSRNYCITLISNCLIYSYDGCAQCDEQYTINPTNKLQCLLSTTINYQLQTVDGKTVVICLQKNFYFNSITGFCELSPAVAVTSVPDCLQNSTSGTCTSCIPGYYLSTDAKSCLDCSNTISNCLTCANNCAGSTLSICLPDCAICLPTHFLFLDQGDHICR